MSWGEILNKRKLQTKIHPRVSTLTNICLFLIFAFENYMYITEDELQRNHSANFFQDQASE